MQTYVPNTMSSQNSSGSPSSSPRPGMPMLPATRLHRKHTEIDQRMRSRECAEDLGSKMQVREGT